MKRLVWCMMILLCLLIAAGITLAEAVDDAQISAALTSNGLQLPAQIQIWGDTAACFATQDGQKMLCVLEKQGDQWELVIRNSKALMQEEEYPTLVLDSDNAIFWTYLFPESVVRFHAVRGDDGIWGCVDETASFAMGEVWYTYNVAWSSENGDEICRSAIVEDENGNDLTHESVEYIPASWLWECISLNDFDLSRFPFMGFSGDYNDSWPGQKFLSDAAATMMPEYTYVNGVWKTGHLHFLMEKPDGNRVYTVCDYSENQPRTVSLIESSVLPTGTYLGVDNFTDSLGIEKPVGFQAITIQSFPNHSWSGIRQVWNFNGESPLEFGRNCYILVSDNRNVIWYGKHSLANIGIINWYSVPTSDAEVKAIISSEEYAVVNNPNPQDRLHLRERPDKGSKSMGKYYSGTPVHVLEIRGDWAFVSVGKQEGWMMKKYLTFGQKDQPLLCNTSAMPELMSKSQYELTVYPWPVNECDPHSILYVNAFSDPSYHSMKIIGIIGDKWYHVWFPENEQYGFVKQSDLWPGNG